MKLLKHIPNTLTCLNLLCGCIGIVFVLEGYPVPAAYFVWAACIFDFFDGFAARWLKASSPIGKELDSLADMVSFGVLPSVMMYSWLGKESDHAYLPFIAFTIAIFSALRLAKFNIDERQTTSFIGLPTPANALFLTALPFLPESILIFTQQTWVLVAIILVFSLLLVAEIELFALKFKSFGWRGNELRFAFLGIALILIVVLNKSSLPAIILLYVLLSLAASWGLVGKKE
ncbi:MAG: CDP-diacylglycerol--serine O-phosphatidyltransferase [Cyclobacteriaceae bacterium]|nr:CDP-diacylglycerol--serine O-phosphatidyltransferase [Cyclobacteriaceae bacterium]